ncbi:SHOCT domain-containing protein [Actinomycetospora lutea]|uniref:SHOCT domain-containing protein n=1 Tax=Actinomycetospora lutea TaxID=663604 RepID=UPI0023664283|nr:SHOCT domain-containing protein [Actinomycetospora lutea]MDD7941045.1 SHOCT domain-containing protein [Actinomycetospora lutea]
MMGSLPMLGWLWPLLIVIGLGLIAAGTIVLVRRRPLPTANRTSTAREVLDARYARGEIDDDDYRHRRDQLR